jgi:hypothetical protein
VEPGTGAARCATDPRVPVPVLGVRVILTERLVPRLVAGEHAGVSDEVESERGALALLAARFVLPGIGPDADAAIRLACDLVANDLDTAATVEVAGLRYGAALRDSEPMIRQMLAEQGMPAAERDAPEPERLAVVLRAVAAGSLAVGEFFGFFMSALPAWDDQSEQQRALVLALNDWAEATTPEEQARTADGVRATAARWA